MKSSDNSFARCKISIVSLLIVGAILSLGVLQPSLATGANGDILWKIPVGGSCNTTALGEDGTIYANVGFFMGQLNAIEPGGNVKWTYNHNGFRCNGVPSITDNGKILADGGDDQTLRAFDKNGNRLWSFNVGTRLSMSAAIASDGTIFVPNRAGELFVLDSNGSLKRTISVSNQRLAVPSIGPSGTIYIGDADGTLHALKKDGTVNWTFQANGRINTAPSFDDEGDIVVGSHDGFLYVLNRDGSLEWKYNSGGQIHNTSTVDKDGTIYVPVKKSPERGVHALSHDGTLKWKTGTSNGIATAPLIGSNGYVYFGTAASSGGSVYSLRPDGSVNWNKNVNSRVRANVTMADGGGTIYFDRGYPNRSIMAVESSARGVSKKAPWPSFQRNMQNTGRAKPLQLCELVPSVKIRPKRVNKNSGVLTLFIKGFKKSKTTPGSIKPSSVKLQGAKPERWKLNPQFLKLKYRRDELNITVNSRKWTEKTLQLKGELKTSGCFDVTRKVLMKR